LLTDSAALNGKQMEKTSPRKRAQEVREFIGKEKAEEDRRSSSA